MKLASLQAGRDGKLVVVSHDLTRMVQVDAFPTLQSALDNWSEAHEVLNSLAKKLNEGSVSGESFDQKDCASPLPRAYQWADGSAYVNHVELVRKARNADMPDTFWTEPLMYQGGSDSFLNPHGHIAMPQSEGFGIDFEAEIAIITDDVPMGVSAEDALSHIKLVMLVNDVSLRGLIPGELAKGFGFFQSKPSSAFSPVCVSPDILGDAWQHGKLPLIAGTIVGSGTVSNKLNGGPGKHVHDGGNGYSCIAEVHRSRPSSMAILNAPTGSESKPHCPPSIFGGLKRHRNRY